MLFPASRLRPLKRLGYRRLLPIVPPGAPISEKSSLAKRLDALGKIPGVRGGDGRWSSYDWIANECDERDIARWQAMQAGIGIKTGQGIVALDADTMNLEWASLIQMEFFKRFGSTPVRIGNFPKALYLIAISAPMKYSRIELTAAMVSEATCIACNVKRIVVAVTPVARGHEMRSLECPQCSNLLMLVVRHRRPHRGARELERRIVSRPFAPTRGM
jgi:hypothetical protein